jgi:hypothetical protein
MLGKDDFVDANLKGTGSSGMGLGAPFGMEKIMGSLVKQLEKQFKNMDLGEGGDGRVQGFPGGFKIKISSGNPQVRRVDKGEPRQERKVIRISPEEAERRAGLPRVDAESKVRRLGDKIVYELLVPGVLDEKEVVIAKLEEGIEIKAYSEDRCYVKVIPLKVEVIGYSVGKGKLFVEVKG